MSMESAAWSTLYRTMSAQQEKRPFSRVTVRRIATFARPQRTALVAFVALSVVGAFLAIATPILAGRVVEAITQRSAVSVVVKLAVLIAVIAVVEAAVGLVSRWLSARIGENLILDLRRAVFDHVQTMPIAFFTRTRTGALVSRLNNDVIGAQRAFSDTLSGVVGNLVALVLTLVVMLRLSWEITALMLVSSLALALVYGLGGFFALRGSLDPGAVVALALLITRLYAPLTGLASARVEVMSALVSFERVFEILDLKPLITEKPDAVAVPSGPVGVEFANVSFAYPAADRVSLASLEEVAVLDNRGGVEVLHDISFRAEPGQVVALVGSSGAGKSTIASLLARLYDVDSGAVTIGGVDVRDLTFASLQQTLGLVTQDGHLFHASVRD